MRVFHVERLGLCWAMAWNRRCPRQMMGLLSRRLFETVWQGSREAAALNHGLGLIGSALNAALRIVCSPPRERVPRGTCWHVCAALGWRGPRNTADRSSAWRCSPSCVFHVDRPAWMNDLQLTPFRKLSPRFRVAVLASVVGRSCRATHLRCTACVERGSWEAPRPSGRITLLGLVAAATENACRGRHRLVRFAKSSGPSFLIAVRILGTPAAWTGSSSMRRPR